MRTIAAILLAVALLLPLTACATDVSGRQWGCWTRENSPYNVVGKIRVPPESTLVIEAGVVVNFRGCYKFIVDSAATLLAVGTQTDSIYFTTDDTATGWAGIRFMGASPNSQISYCRLQYGKAAAMWLHPGTEGGAIYCHYSSPIISDNSITNNSAGGIYCYHSSPKISNNTIRDNYCGGIDCSSSNPAISGNTIIGNSTDANGGGIYCRYSDPLIIGNIIGGNSAAWDGGGIYCEDWCDPVISNNTISRNWAGYYGGGIFSYNSDGEISSNTITGNSASRKGGGICLGFLSNPRVTGNTLSGNSASPDGAGGVYCDESDPRIANTILWGDTAPEICLYRSSPKVIYCNIQGGWEGRGNIDADPLFVGSEREDFHLRWHSPCIDAGVPDSLDPDGTRSDIGAFYFNQRVPGIVELYPHDTPIVIPPQGGDITYDGWVFNFFGHQGRIDIWTYAFVPEMGRYGPIDLYQNVRIPADTLGRNEITEHVPGVAPQGDYVFVAYIGDYPSTIIDSSWFYFAKTGSVAEGIADWQSLNGWLDGEVLSRESGVPAHYALSQNYPNPFNALTVIKYQLPVDGHVKLEVYNLFGQSVATLVDSKQQAGYRSVVWDASEVSSGLYFYRLTAGDFTQTRRMMVVK
jgi:parallel beta-helix repeat protein